MDDALIKAQRVRRVVKVLPATQAQGGVEGDVVARGTLVEVRDPRALRPRDFRADFVYGPQETTDDVAQCDLPPAMESVLGGTDATIIIAGTEDSGQAELLDAPHGLTGEAVRRMCAELQERQARHRQGGGGGYSFQMKLMCFQVVGDRIEDLMSDHPEPARLADKVTGPVVDGLRAVAVAGAREAVDALEAAQRRRDLTRRGQCATAMVVEVTQADYWAGWGLFGRLCVLELPALDCLAEDRGLVQLRSGFDTFRGVYHLRNLVKAWKPLQPGEVTTTSLTWLLRDVLCGGSVAATFIFSLQQHQPAASCAVLEFLDDLGKVETNPVCCDHRVAGFSRALRADCLQARQALLAGRAGASIDQEGIEDARQIIIKLERRLREAERDRDESTKARTERQGLAVDAQDKYLTAIQGQEQMHEQLVASEEDRLRACHGLVEMQLQNTEIRDEMSEMHYKDNMLLVVLEQDVAEMQVEMRQRQQELQELEASLETSVSEHRSVEGKFGNVSALADRHVGELAEQEALVRTEASELQGARREAEQLQQSLDFATEARVSLEVSREVQGQQLQNRIDTLELELQRAALSQGREHGEVEAQTADAQRELRTERHMASELQVQLDLAREGERKAVQAQDAASAEVSRARAEFQQSLSDFAKGGSEGDSALQRIAEAAGMSTSREQALLSQNQELQAHVRELQDQLAFASKTALNWAPPNASGADKSRLERAIPDAAARAATAGSESMQKTSDLQTRVSTLQGELEHVRHQAAVAAAEHSRDLQRREQEYSTELTKRDVEAAARNAENRELKEMRAKENIGVKAQQQLGGSGQEAQLIEENRVLQEKLATIQDQTPANQRAQLQRLGFLEKTSRTLEAERSELLVRATVAEEQLTELQRHLKEMTKSYQMEIANLKLELQRAR